LCVAQGHRELFRRLLWRIQTFTFLAAGQRSLGFFPNDVVAKLNTLITDENGRASDQLADFVL
jgi:hypothetical protein